MDRFHVAAIPFMGSGHINPMLELSRRLTTLTKSLACTLGFTVSFLLTEKDIDHSRMQPPSDESHIRFVSIPNLDEASLLMGPDLESLESVLNSFSPSIDCILFDFFLIGWSQDLANRLGVPGVALVTINATSERFGQQVPLLISKGYIPVNARLNDEALIDFLPGIEPFHPRQLPISWREDNPLVHVLGERLQRLKEPKCVLVNSIEELEENVVASRRLEIENYLPVGPLTAATGDGFSEHDPCFTWLEKQAPGSVLYVAFGSVCSLAADKVELIAGALRSTGQPFLWSMRRDLVSNPPEKFYERIMTSFSEEQGLVVEWAPQVQVLRHASVGGFSTHCGWNSTMEALSSGVPTLCWPLGAEQNVNAYAMVETWKVGLMVAGVTGDEIEEKIQALMRGGEGVEMRSNAQELQSVVNAAHAPGGCSHKNFQRFQSLMFSPRNKSI